MFSIKTDRIKKCATQMDAHHNNMNSIAGEAEQALAGSSISSSAYATVRQVLNQQAGVIRGIASNTAAMSGALQSVITQYEKSEKEILGNTGYASLKLHNGIFTTGYDVEKGKPVTTSVEMRKASTDDDFSFDTKLKGKTDISSDEFKQFKKDHSDSKNVYFVQDENGNWKKIDPNDKDAVKEAKDGAKLKPDVDVALYKAGVSAGWTGVAGTYTLGDKDGTYFSMTGKIADAEAHADTTVGLGYVKASAGASFTAFSGSVDGQVGTDMLGIYGNANVELGRVGANAEAQMGLFDAEGNFSPALYAGASAEAILAEASATGGVEIAGTKVGVTGKVNFGLGAHFNIGYKDGKLYADLGASIGVGGSIAVEVDMSGTIKAVCDGAQSIYEGITEGAQEIGNAIQDSINSTRENLKAIGGWVSSWFGH